ncbi:MAG TPA: sugar ABC transporter ATP-binding protein [Firmicutes bacterium]|jgi:ribose transport system ATP-binding protein|nr:sugar ABC transporter ATP-binding protein [Bacillota bacterium]
MGQEKYEEILVVRDIRKTFGDTVALQNIHFNLRAGEVHCLVGENGAGKSTLIKILSGAERPDSGKMIFFGHEYSRMTPDLALEMGVATIYQDVELIESLSVADNIFLGHEIKIKLGIIDYAAQNQKARELMDSINIGIDATTLVEELSPAEQQTLQIVKALHIHAKIMIMDEPTSSLGVEETKALMELVKKLTAQNIGVIYISHYLEEVFAISDRITVLKDGQAIGTFETKSTDLKTITKNMIGREGTLFYHREAATIGEPVFEVRNLSRHGVFEDVSFNLHQGEILGFGGIVGAGRTELMNVIFGVDRKDSGEIWLNGHMISPLSPREALDCGIGMIPEDRKLLGLFNLRSVLENMLIIKNETGGLVLNHRKENNIAADLIKRLHIVTANLKLSAGFLSGGNQQKVILARLLLSKAEVFIFDEPTKGVDIGAKEQIYELMVQLAKEGKSILMVSSDMPELISVSDRIAIMREGKLVSIVKAKETSEHELLEYFLGIKDNGGITHE